MRKAGVLCIAALLAGATAAAGAYLIDERFNGGGLPAGWTFSSYGVGSWSIVNGPWGNCLRLYGSGSMHYGGGQATIKTNYLSLQPGTIHYRFYRSWSWSAPSPVLVATLFRIYRVGSSTPLVEQSFSPYQTGWLEVTGSVALTTAATIYGYWSASGSFQSGSNGSCYLFVDTVQFSNEAMTGFAPASFGKLKILYQ
jgi:hypothetical protein